MMNVRKPGSQILLGPKNPQRKKKNQSSCDQGVIRERQRLINFDNLYDPYQLHELLLCRNSKESLCSQLRQKNVELQIRQSEINQTIVCQICIRRHKPQPQPVLQVQKVDNSPKEKQKQETPLKLTVEEMIEKEEKRLEQQKEEKRLETLKQEKMRTGQVQEPNDSKSFIKEILLLLSKEQCCSKKQDKQEDESLELNEVDSQQQMHSQRMSTPSISTPISSDTVYYTCICEQSERSMFQPPQNKLQSTTE